MEKYENYPRIITKHSSITIPLLTWVNLPYVLAAYTQISLHIMAVWSVFAAHRKKAWVNAYTKSTQQWL